MNKTYKYTYNVRLLYTISIQCTPTQKEYLYDTHDEIESRTNKLEEHVKRNYLNLLRCNDGNGSSQIVFVRCCNLHCLHDNLHDRLIV